MQAFVVEFRGIKDRTDTNEYKTRLGGCASRFQFCGAMIHGPVKGEPDP